MIKLSASSISTYDKCPKKYHYQYIEKPKIEKVDWPHLEFGTVAHRVLELFHEHLIHNVAEVSDYKDIMKESFLSAVKESKERKKYHLIKPSIVDLKKVIQNYLDAIKRDSLPPVLHNEMEFKFMIGDHLIRGFIDRIDKHEDGFYHIVDYKTSKNPDYLDAFQLELYALALKERYDDVKVIKGSYSLLKHNAKLKSWDITDKMLVAARERVIKAGEDINTETLWKKKPTFLCNWCDFQSICQNSWTTEEQNEDI